MKEGPWSSAIGWISTHRNLLWSKATVVNVAMVEQCERSPRSAVPVANGRPERPLQNVGDIFAAALTYGRRSRISHSHARARDVVIHQQLLVLLHDIFGELAADADNIFVVPML
jgi:hypothetical protein